MRPTRQFTVQSVLSREEAEGKATRKSLIRGRTNSSVPAVITCLQFQIPIFFLPTVPLHHGPLKWSTKVWRFTSSYWWYL